MWLVAVATAHFPQSDRKFLVAGDALLEDQHMRWAVHRFQRHPVGIAGDDFAFVFGVRNLVRDDEHVLPIFAPVARLLPLARVHHLRRLDFLIAGTVHLAAHIGLKLAPDLIAIGMPKHAAMRLFLQMEQVHLTAQLAVIAQGGLFQTVEVRIQLLLVQPAGSVDARQLRIALIAAPIRARNAHQLEGVRVKLAGRGQMRPAAHVEPVIT